MVDEEGENKIQALIRELKEEINTAEISNIKELKHTFYFDFPHDLAKEIVFTGQKVFLFSADFDGKESDVIVDGNEISGFEFLKAEDFLERLTWETTKEVFKKIYV